MENYSMGHYLETKKEEQSFLHRTHYLYLIHIPIKFHTDNPKLLLNYGVNKN